MSPLRRGQAILGDVHAGRSRAAETDPAQSTRALQHRQAPVIEGAAMERGMPPQAEETGGEKAR